MSDVWTDDDMCSINRWCHLMDGHQSPCAPAVTEPPASTYHGHDSFYEGCERCALAAPAVTEPDLRAALADDLLDAARDVIEQWGHGVVGMTERIDALKRAYNAVVRAATPPAEPGDDDGR